MIDRRELAVWFLGAGLVVGFLGNLFFYDKAIGLSFPLFILAIVGAVLALYVQNGAQPRLRALWPVAPMLFFAAMVAVHDDPLISMLNIAAGLTLGAVTLHYLPLLHDLDEASTGHHILAAVSAGIYASLGAVFELPRAAAWMREQRHEGEQGKSRVGAVVRGLLLSLPVLLIFVVLLASADVIFGDYVSQIFDVLNFEALEDFFGQLTLTLVLAWAVTGIIAYGVARTEAPESSEEESTPEPDTGARPLGLIEASIVLGSVDVLFGAFVLVQFAYFFGGRVNISIEGLTYAEYARRGFFELVAVSVLVLGLSLAMNWATGRHTAAQENRFRALVVVMIALTLVMLVSASRRMALYVEVYGLTHLRVYTHVFMLWLGVLLAVFAVSLFGVKKHLFSLGIVLVAVGYVATLNLVNVDYYIADWNIDHYQQGANLDVDYLRILSADAVPAILPFYESLPEASPYRQTLAPWLTRQYRYLERTRSGGLFAANLSRSRAWALLDSPDR